MQRALLYSNKRWQRVAIVKNKELIFYEEEITKYASDRGNVYWGTITRVSSALNAVFVDIGLEKDGFLPLYSIHPRFFHIKPDKITEIVQMIKKEKVNLKQSVTLKKLKIEKVLKAGQKIQVQIIRDSHENKGPMLSTFITLKSKNVKLIGNTLENKIIFAEKADEKIKKNLKLNNFSVFINHSVKTEDLIKEMDELVEKWKKINEKKEGSVYVEDHLLVRFLRSEALEKVDAVSCENCLDTNLPTGLSLKNKILENGFNIFADYEEQIEEIYGNIVQLKSGGYLIFNETAAGHTIDINLGKKTQQNSLSAIKETNLEAIPVIYKQIILRNLGGMILIDFIDMDPKDNKIVETEINKYIEKDEIKVQINPISSFGIMELCRQHTVMKKQNICTTCYNGNMISTEYISERVLQKIKYLTVDKDFLELHISVPIAEYFLNNCAEDIFEIQKNTELNFIVSQNTQPNYYQVFSNLNLE